MRYLKIAGEIGPKGEQGLLKLIENKGGVYLGENDKSEINDETLRSAVNEEGLVLYCSNPNPQSMSDVTRYCGKIGLLTKPGDTISLPVKSCTLPKKGLKFVSEDPAFVIETAMSSQKRAKKTNVVIQPEALVTLSPFMRNQMALNLVKAAALDQADLVNFKNEVENKAKRLCPSSRKMVLDYMDELAKKDNS